MTLSKLPNCGRVSNAKIPLIIPAAAITPIIGLIEPVINPIKLPKALETGFLPSSSGAGAASLSKGPNCLTTSSKTLVTSLPITT